MKKESVSQQSCSSWLKISTILENVFLFYFDTEAKLRFKKKYLVKYNLQPVNYIG